MRRCLRATKRLVIGTLALVLLYAIVGVAGTLIPVNRQWREPREGIEIFVTTNGVHTGFVVPTKTTVIDWRERLPARWFRGDVATDPFVGFGWGDKRFYLEVKTLADLTVGIALASMFGFGPSAVHVRFFLKPEPDEAHRRLTLTEAQYRVLVDWILASFATNQTGAWRHIPDSGYTDWDTMLDGQGSYSLLYTCNSWTNGALKRMGVRTALWTPMAQGVMFYR